MKKSIFLFSILILILTAFMACNSEAQNKGKAKVSATAAVANNDKLEVVYFHSEHRCKTCIQIEKMARQVLEQSYGEQVKNGKIIFSMYNVDDDKNKAIARKYEAAGSALYLNRIKADKEKITDLTDFSFTNAFNEQVFREKFTNYINEQLK